MISSIHPLQKDKRDAVGSSNPTWRNYDHEYWIGIERELEMKWLVGWMNLKNKNGYAEATDGYTRCCGC
jgi:hypothetical protein